jgi:outer membrane lipoprotein LolB
LNTGKVRALLLLLAALSSLTGCVTTPPVTGPVDERHLERAAALAEIQRWSLEGRLAVSDGEDGGSGTLVWQQAPEWTRMVFHGALGRGAWRLSVDPGAAKLELADGRNYRAESVDALVQRELGWRIPVSDLSFWVRGLEAPGPVEGRRLDADGNLVELSQRGWLVEYGRYRDTGGISLPSKMTARRADRSVKLAVRKWSLGAVDG